MAIAPTTRVAASPRAEPPSPANESGPPDTDGDVSELQGKKAPSISGRTLDGRDNFAMQPGSSGEVVVLHFWATWCAPCQKSLPMRDALQRQHAGKIRVVALSVDDDPAGIPEFVAQARVNLTMAWDRNLATANRYAPKTMPSTFVIDKSGVVRSELRGYQDGDEATLAARIKDAM